MKTGLIVMTVALMAARGAHAQAEWGMQATALAGVPIESGAGHSSRWTVQPRVKLSGGPIEWRGELRIRSLDQQGKRRTDVDIRELTASWQVGESYLTVGAQQLNWGRMDILRLIDTVNPLDQADLFYQELSESKLALWMLNWEWQRGMDTLQVAVTPQVPVDRLPTEMEHLPVIVDKPSPSLRNATVAVRYGLEWQGWNADLMAIHGWQSAPVMHAVLAQGAPRLEGTVRRQDKVGLSADKPFGPTVLRLEGTYATTHPAHGSAETRLHKIDIGVGLDIRVGPWLLVGQVIAEHVPRRQSSSVPYQPTNYLSAIIQRKWMQDRLSTRALYIQETQGRSSWSSLQLGFELSERQEIKLQIDSFRGGAAESFGAFKERSRVSVCYRIEF